MYSGLPLPAARTSRTLDDIFVTQDEIATAVVNALKVSLLEAWKAMPKADG